MRSVFKALIFGTLLAGVTNACTADQWNGGPWSWPGPMGGPMHGPMGCPMYGSMMRGRMGANPMPPETGPESLLKPNSPEARLFNQYCTQCHALPSPAQHTGAEWPLVVARMRMHMQDLSQQVQVPSQPELEKIITYLQEHTYPSVGIRK